MEHLWLIILIIAAVHVLGGIAGFGSSLLAMASIAMLGGKEGITIWLPVMAICGLLQASLIVLKSRKHTDYQSLLYIILFAPIGLPIGYLLLTQLNSMIITFFLGSLLIIGGLVPLIRDITTKKIHISLRAIILIFVGIIHGGFASGGTLLIPYARMSIPEKDAFRATLAYTWLTLNGALLLVIFIKGDTIQVPTHAVLITCITVIAATLLGQYIATKINQERFAIFASTCMIIAGLVYIARQFI